jgi:hypothetical protein
LVHLVKRNSPPAAEGKVPVEEVNPPPASHLLSFHSLATGVKAWKVHTWPLCVTLFGCEDLLPAFRGIQLEFRSIAASGLTSYANVTSTCDCWKLSIAVK